MTPILRLLATARAHGMLRLALPFGTVAAVFLLGEALTAHDWYAACPLAVLVIVGLFFLVPDTPTPTQDNTR